MTVCQPSFERTSTDVISRRHQAVNEPREDYLNHPTWGLLYSVCEMESNQGLFATIYAHRVFFLVTSSATSNKFEPISRTDAQSRVETRLRHLYRQGQSQEYDQLQLMYQQSF